MPKLKECPACKGTVSSEAKACPHCGQPLPDAIEVIGQIGSGLFALGLLVILLGVLAVFVFGC